MEQNNNYSSITNEILERTATFKNCVAVDFIPGDKSIIDGIELFETTLKELNPEYIDEDIQEFIKNIINNVMTNIEEAKQKVNHRMHYGINCCYTILEGFKNGKKRDLKKH